jgi:DNA replication and repair protein RecF
VEIRLDKGAKKSIKINGIPINRMGELMGQVNCVFFSPDELRLVKDAPADRRRFLDIDISQIDKQYFYTLMRYNKTLLQRNTLLKSLTNTQIAQNKKNDIDALRALDIWDEQLVKAGSALIARRLSFINQLKTNVTAIHNFLTSGKEQIELSYINITSSNAESADYTTTISQSPTTSPPSHYHIPPPKLLHTPPPICISPTPYTNTLPPSLATPADHFEDSVPDVLSIETLFLSQLQNARNKDLRQKTTTVGPHRDDLRILIDGKDVRSFASQGQQRTVALSLKLAELEIFKSKTGEMPILLLDDVLSELDEKRSQRLLQALTACQSIITSANMPTEVPQNAKIFEIVNGRVKPK